MPAGRCIAHVDVDRYVQSYAKTKWSGALQMDRLRGAKGAEHFLSNMWMVLANVNVRSNNHH